MSRRDDAGALSVLGGPGCAVVLREGPDDALQPIPVVSVNWAWDYASGRLTVDVLDGPDASFRLLLTDDEGSKRPLDLGLFEEGVALELDFSVDPARKKIARRFDLKARSLRRGPNGWSRGDEGREADGRRSINSIGGLKRIAVRRGRRSKKGMELEVLATNAKGETKKAVATLFLKSTRPETSE